MEEHETEMECAAAFSAGILQDVQQDLLCQATHSFNMYAHCDKQTFTEVNLNSLPPDACFSSANMPSVVLMLCCITANEIIWLQPARFTFLKLN